MSKTQRPWLLTAGLLVTTHSAWAQQAPAPAPKTPASIPPSPTAVPVVPAATTPTREQRLDSRTAVTLALRNNPDYRASELDIKIANQDVLSAEGQYPYIYDANAGFTRSESPSIGPNDSVRSNVSRRYDVGTGIHRTFPFGTRAEVRVDGSRFENDVTTSTSFPDERSGIGYTVTGRAEVTQPLLRGFGTTVGEAQLRASRVSRSLTEKTYRKLTSQLVRDVLSSYWELWLATESVQIEQAALDLAKRQEQEAVARVQGGALSLAELLTFQTRVAELEESVVAADVLKRQRSLELGQLIGSSDDSTPQFVAATEPPNVGATATRADVEAALRSGSLELAEAEARVRLARTQAEAAGDSSRPRLDLSGFVQTTGVSERVPRAFERAGRMGWITTGVTATFEMPLDNAQLNAARTKALLQVRRAETSLKTARDGILATATLAVTNETAAHQRFALAERTLAVAQRAWEAEKARFELGNSIPITVQQAEDGLRRARLRVAQARVDLAQAQLAVLHLAGKLVERYSSG
jgi:outer membrane protein TolC